MPAGRGADRRAMSQTTSWPLIIAAAKSGNSAAAEALSEVCLRYRQPVEAIIRGQAATQDEAEDLTQAFFERFLEKNFLAQADPARGRFRQFLFASVKHFLSNARDRERAGKRGGGRAHLPIEEPEVQRAAATSLTPEQLFDRQWAVSLIEQAMSELRSEAQAQRDQRFELLVPFLTGDASSGEYREIAAATGSTENALRVAVHRLRERFRQKLRAIVAETVEEEHEVEDEIRFLMRSLSAR